VPARRRRPRPAPRRRLRGHQRRDVIRAQGQNELHLGRQRLAFLDLGLAAEPDERASLGLRRQRGQLSDAEHRGQRRRHRTAVKTRQQADRGFDRVAPEQQDDITRGDAALGQAGRQRHRGTPKIAVADAARAHVQCRLPRVEFGAADELAPQVTAAPVALGVITLGVGLESQDRHPISPRHSNCHAGGERGRAKRPECWSTVPHDLKSVQVMIWASLRPARRCWRADRGRWRADRRWRAGPRTARGAGA
jgi:hypothetical protein